MLAIIARAIPVFPLVGSINFMPGLIYPLFKACCIILNAALSLTLPPGFWPSIFAKIRTWGCLKIVFISIRGVLPINCWIDGVIYGAIFVLI